jgi:hypothetical protein
MCGRFTRNYTWQEIHDLYGLTQPALNLEPRYNICPTTIVDVVISGDGERSLVPMRWGLIPGWWEKLLKELRLATFNARAEAIAEKQMFRDRSIGRAVSCQCQAITNGRIPRTASNRITLHGAMDSCLPSLQSKMDGSIQKPGKPSAPVP